jgi:hypothetical protein
MPETQEINPVPHSLERLAEYHRAFGIDCVTLGGALWVDEGRAIIPKGPACQDFSLAADQEATLLTHFRKAVLITYTDGFHEAHDDACPWYAVTCRRFMDLGEYNSHFRSMIRRGLKNCSVRKVDAEYLADHAFGTYRAAYARYRDRGPPDITETAWSNRMRLNADFPDLREYWAVFVQDQLAGYSANWIFGKAEAAYSQIKIDPQFLGAYPSYALFFMMNQYYLQEQSFQYVNDGYKNIGHETGIQDFLIQKFGFQRTPTNLYARYRPWIAASLAVPRFVRRMLCKLSGHYASLCAMEEARVCSRRSQPSLVRNPLRANPD